MKNRQFSVSLWQKHCLYSFFTLSLCLIFSTKLLHRECNFELKSKSSPIHTVYEMKHIKRKQSMHWIEGKLSIWFFAMNLKSDSFNRWFFVLTYTYTHANTHIHTHTHVNHKWLMMVECAPYIWYKPSHIRCIMIAILLWNFSWRIRTTFNLAFIVWGICAIWKCVCHVCEDRMGMFVLSCLHLMWIHRPFTQLSRNRKRTRPNSKLKTQIKSQTWDYFNTVSLFWFV